MNPATSSMSTAASFVHAATVNCLNALLRNELSAVETYQQALSEPADESRSCALQALATEHAEAAQALKTRIEELGAVPVSGSGMWGVVMRTAEGAAKLFGPGAALLALREAEEHRVKKYESSLVDVDLDLESRVLIGSLLLPKAQAHLSTIDRFLPLESDTPIEPLVSQLPGSP